MVFSSPAPAPHHNLGRGCKRLLACPPAAPQRLPHVAAHRLIVVCYFFHVFHDPREGCGGLRPPGAVATPKNLRRPFWSSLPPMWTPGDFF